MLYTGKRAPETLTKGNGTGGEWLKDWKESGWGQFFLVLKMGRSGEHLRSCSRAYVINLAQINSFKKMGRRGR